MSNDNLGSCFPNSTAPPGAAPTPRADQGQYSHSDRRQYSGRRQWLERCGMGCGMLALGNLLARTSQGATGPVNAMAARPPHFPNPAKAVIWLFINGGPSPVDTWDYKPALQKWNGKPIQEFDSTFKNTTGFFRDSVGGIMQSPFNFRQYGESGKWVSDLFPNLARHVDKMAFVHSLHSESNNHSPALFMMNSGFPRMGYPCVGSWVTYGLGCASHDLPAFIVMSDPLGRGLPKGHAANWGAGFLPSIYQGTWLKPEGSPIDNLERLPQVSAERQVANLRLLKELNEAHRSSRAEELELAARIESFELAYRMQSAAPEALNLASEPAYIHAAYGTDSQRCGHFGAQCLIARRLVERGVRFIQIYSGGMENQRSWDGHSDIQGNHHQFSGETDQPIAALLGDLEQRGLLDSTLVVWGGEFGRLPIAQTGAKPGRDHNPHAITYWLAGGRVRGGVSYGESDEIGFRATVDRAHVNDLHATILHLLGMDHEQLTYLYNGRRFRLTDVAGHVIQPIVTS